MARGATIGRLMVAVALIAAAFGLGVSWAGPAWTLGELAPMGVVSLVGLALAVVTSGRIRRFFAGLATTSVILALVFWVAPLAVRRTVIERILLPLDQRFGPRSERPAPGFTSKGARLDRTMFLMSLFWPRPIVEQDHSRFVIGTTRSPFLSREAQFGLGLLQLVVATTGGVIAAIPRSRAARTVAIVPEPTRSDLP